MSCVTHTRSPRVQSIASTYRSPIFNNKRHDFGSHLKVAFFSSHIPVPYNSNATKEAKSQRHEQRIHGIEPLQQPGNLEGERKNNAADLTATAQTWSKCSGITSPHVTVLRNDEC